MDLHLENKVVLVTGAGSQVGYRILNKSNYLGL